MKTTMTKVITLSMLTATFLHATNGDHLIGIGAEARGMGGTGIALSHGAESGLANPALITAIEGTEISFGGTIFMPNIEARLSNAPFEKSAADIAMIPEVSIAHKISDNFYIGIGMWGTAGMGTDYRDNPNLFNMVTNLQLLQFGIPLAYKTKGFSLAVTPVIQYGNLDINYVFGPANVGTGIAQDFGLGYNLGLTYNFEAVGAKEFTLGMTYKSAIEMNYDKQLTTATGPFGVVLPDGDALEQPAEIGMGLAFVRNKHTLAFDYKKIKWSKSKGYSDFGWEDQDVYAIGYQYTHNKLSFRTGFNYASSAVTEGLNPSLNFFNLLGFPATSEKHYTVGTSYQVSKNYSIDLAYVYAAKSKKTFSIQGLGAPTISNNHTENSLSFQLNYTF